MKVIRNWKKVLLKAASVRWMAAAALFSGAEAALPFVTDIFGFHPRVFAATTFCIVGLALVFRFKAQKAFEDEEQ